MLVASTAFSSDNWSADSTAARKDSPWVELKAGMKDAMLASKQVARMVYCSAERSALLMAAPMAVRWAALKGDNSAVHSAG